ncbi:uncharacterized protein CLUP02_12576 [Colletotrichum lupini]|uniref:Uncharacterized protein n=1 Tax=Colletotrichum lupini TaxID=145971 RepID=A0A9Q8T0M8_9PEZI|nr:uncharacterized protein CLUP02_12576 [Colletotrichum lupini]UQC87074.1 hypothetical protein CLUP02_12576 [Colletotrichum lupini]
MTLAWSHLAWQRADSEVGDWVEAGPIPPFSEDNIE